jgi:proline iminopeptidase
VGGAVRSAGGQQDDRGDPGSEESAGQAGEHNQPAVPGEVAGEQRSERCGDGRDADLRDRAARSWCAWEERLATLHGTPEPSPRYADPAFRRGFARLVTHFFGEHAFLPRDGISGRTSRIADIPAVLVRGRLDIASPLGVTWRLARHLPLAILHVVEDEDHGGAGLTEQLLVQATNRFAERPAPA